MVKGASLQNFGWQGVPGPPRFVTERVKIIRIVLKIRKQEEWQSRY